MPVYIVRFPNGDIEGIHYWKHSLQYYSNNGRIPHRDNGPALLNFASNGRLVRREYICERRVHRIDGPAKAMWYMETGGLRLEEWRIHNKFHRVGGPARQTRDTEGNVTRLHYIENGKFHRTNGPAKIDFSNGNLVRQCWYHMGKLHRANGPAKIEFDTDGAVAAAEWFYHGDPFQVNITQKKILRVAKLLILAPELPDDILSMIRAFME